MKRILSIIITISILIMSVPVTLTVCAQADTSHIKYEYTDVERTSVPFTLCESKEGFFVYNNASFELDKSNGLNGQSCIDIKMQTNPENFIYLVYDAQDRYTDATGFTHIEMDIYIEDDSFLSDLHYAFMELSSEGECDVAEVSFEFFNGFVKGWNHICFPIAHGQFNSTNEKTFDISHVNYMRIYGVTKNSFDLINIKLDNVYFTKGNGGSVPNQPVMMGESIVGIGLEANTYVELDKENKVAGNSSVRLHAGENPNRLVLFQYTPAEPIDASGLTHFEMDVYVEDPYFLSNITTCQFELCSGGAGDVEELSYNFFSSLKKGWTHIVLPLAKGISVSTNGIPFDITRFNFLRFYMFYDTSLTNVDINLCFDNMSFTDGNGVTVYKGKNGNYKNDYIPNSTLDYGNVDNDTEISVVDALSILQYSVKKTTFKNAQINKADVDNDKSVTTRDALCVLQYMVEKIQEFPVQKDMENFTLPQEDLGHTTPRIIHTKYYTDQAVVAEVDVTAFGAYGDGLHDDYLSFQMALEYVEYMGGGTVFVPVGTYKIGRALRIPRGVTLRGDSPIITDGKSQKAEGTILYAYSGRNRTSNENFLQLYNNAGVHNVSIYYPEQDADNPVPYSYTIREMEHYGISVNNVNLINSYNGIQMGHDTNSLQNIVNLTGCVLDNGILLDQNVDICRMENIYFSPNYWINSGLVNFDDTTKLNLKTYVRTRAVGYKLQHIDWIYLNDVYMDGMYVGIKFMMSEKGAGYTGGPNGHVYNFNTTNCAYGVYCEYVNAIGMMFTKGNVDADVPFYFGKDFTSSATINSTKISTAQTYGLLNEGSGDVTLDKCTFVNTGTTSQGTAIYLSNGSFAATNCSAQNFTYDVALVGSAKNSKVINFNKVNSINKNDPYSRLTVIWDDEYYTPEYTELEYDQQIITRPSAHHFIDITTYEYSGDTSKGIAGKLQSAIDTLYAQGGGIVYVPAGSYTLETNLLVREGVEVRGSAANSPHHSYVPSTIFFTDYGRFEEGTEEEAQNATALFTLKSRSGISGFKVAYPRQYENNRFVPYAYTIRGDGEAFYVKNVTDCNCYFGIDLHTNKCDGHVIDGYSGSPIRKGVTVGGGSVNGIVKNCQLNCHYYFDNPYVGFRDATLTADLLNYQKAEMESFILRDTVDQILYSNFSFGTKSGIVIDEGADGFILAQGADSSTYPLLVRGESKGGSVDMVNTQLVVLGTVADREYIRVEGTFDGNLTLIQNNMWGESVNGISVHGGNVAINQGTLLRAGKMGVRVYGNTNLRLSGLCNRQSDVSLDIFSGNTTASIVYFANRFVNGTPKTAVSAKYVKSTDF